jgi:ketosteroid isomerase-like protein
MIDRTWADTFARDWIEGWNSRDLERVLAHYADDFEMTSPLIVERLGIADGRLKGKETVRRYWAQGLAATPQLHFDLSDVMVGVRQLDCPRLQECDTVPNGHRTHRVQ